MKSFYWIAFSTLVLTGAAGAQPVEATAPLLLLPEVTYAAVGVEANIYFSSLAPVPPGKRLIFKITSAKGRQQAERWTFTPEEKDVGEFPLGVEVRDLDDLVVARGSTLVRVASGRRLTGNDLTYLPIGDSLTEAGVYTAELLKLFAASGVGGISLLGTHHSGGPENNLHEGYSGWTFADFLTRFDPVADAAGGRKGSSPFVFAEGGKPVFDLARYFREKTKGQLPAAVTIFLGTNDVFTATEQNREAVVQSVLANASQLVREIRRAAPHAKVGIVAPLAPSSQDGFGENYGTEFDAWNYRKNQVALLRALMAQCSGRENQGVYFVPAYLGFDSEGDYPTATQPRNARTAATLSRQSNALHPAEPGYLHVADGIFAWMINVL